MKNLVILFLISVVFISCSDDIEYAKGNNVVKGVWNSYYENSDSLVLTRVFTDDYFSYFSYSDGKTQKQLNKQMYTITESEIKLEKYTQSYRLEEDTLRIENSIKDKITVYVRSKSEDSVDLE